MIEVENLHVSLGSRPILNGIGFDVPAGAVTGFLGPNGAGKSTTMKAILGLVPSQGVAHIDGQAYSDLDRPFTKVGAVLDDAQPHGDLTGHRHLRWMARTHGITSSRVDEVLNMVGLRQDAGRRVKTYSFGMRQRLALAGALLGDPSVLVLDEPTNGLDPEGIRWIRELLRSLASDGRTVFVSSHHLTEMSYVADRVVLIDRGAVIGESTTAELAQRVSATAIRIQTPDPMGLARLLDSHGVSCSIGPDHRVSVRDRPTEEIEALARAGGQQIFAMTAEAPPLEEIFFELVGASRRTGS